MNKSELLKELRALTQAGMKDCLDALKESGDDLEKAVDIIKTKGQNIVNSRAASVAAEGVLVSGFWQNSDCAVMAEVNCQTDFVANSPEFVKFAQNEVLRSIYSSLANDTTFVPNETHLEDARKSLVAKFKENIVVRRWWIEQVLDKSCRTFNYVHTGSKLGVVLSLKAPSVEAAESKEFQEIGADLAMQIAAMNPLAASVERIPADVLDRQKGIFEAQLKEMNKPQAAWAKILEGKLNKWYTEICLTRQESVMVPKSTIEQLIKTQYAKQLGGELEVINFVRAQVGEGIEVKQSASFTDEVAKMSGVSNG